VVHRRPQLPAGARPPANLVPRSPHASPTIWLALLSDSVLLRSALRSILRIERSFEVVAEAASPPVHDFVRSSSPHIILVDVQVKGALSVSSELRENGAPSFEGRDRRRGRDQPRTEGNQSQT
jgi:hypothetical protein